MQEPRRPDRREGSSRRTSVERSYIRQNSKWDTAQIPVKGKYDAFQKVIFTLTVLLTVSLVILLGVFAAGQAVISFKEWEVEQQEVENLAKQQEIELIDALATSLEPIEEPSIYANFTSESKLLTGIRSEYAILIDIEKNEIVAHKNGDVKMFPASMTKVMTLIVAYENIEDMNEKFTFSYLITDPAYKAGASVAGFLSSESVPLIDILYGIALPSGADATTAIAVHVAGSEEAFVELMNEKAVAMGLENTHFMNASGLHDPEHYSTAHDMAKIFQYAMNVPLLAEIMSTYKYTTTPTTQHPDGILLVSTVFSRMRGDEPEVAEVISGKTGYTPEAGYCLVTCAEANDGKRYILATGKAAPNAEYGQYGAIFDAIDIYKKYTPSF